MNKMTPIRDLVKKYGSQQKLADAMGVQQNQINRWCKAEALVSQLTGEVYIKTKTVKCPL